MARIRARYAVRGPRKEDVTYMKCSMDENGSLQQEAVTEKRDCYMIYFPQGHSIRVTSFAALKELGFHLKPRMVDMETGDVLDTGGDPYDFENNPQGDATNVNIIEEDEVKAHAPQRTKVRSE